MHLYPAPRHNLPAAAALYMCAGPLKNRAMPEQSLIDAIMQNPIERVLILLLCVGVLMLWKRLNAMQDKYTELLREVVVVLEKVPAKLDSTWKEAVAELKLHMQQLLGPIK